MLTATCHCGAICVTIPRRPRSVTDCNCSICRRYGVLWAYYKASTVRLEAKPGSIDTYSWGRGALRFVRCAKCGCVMSWQRTKPDPDRKIGVNLRNFGLDVLSSARVRPFNGAAWDGRTH